MTAMFLAGVFAIAPTLLAQKARADSAEKNPRKLLYKVEPEYPIDLKRAYIGGLVRLDVTISARGTVDTVSILGGNPVLAECASKAVKRWKYTPAGSESSLRLDIRFDPHH